MILEIYARTLLGGIFERGGGSNWSRRNLIGRNLKGGEIFGDYKNASNSQDHKNVLRSNFKKETMPQNFTIFSCILNSMQLFVEGMFTSNRDPQWLLSYGFANLRSHFWKGKDCGTPILLKSTKTAKVSWLKTYFNQSSQMIGFRLPVCCCKFETN